MIPISITPWIVFCVFLCWARKFADGEQGHDRKLGSKVIVGNCGTNTISEFESNAFRSYYILAANPHFLDHDRFDIPQGSTVVNPRPSAAAESLLAFSWIPQSPAIQEQMAKALQGTANKAFEICTGNIEVCPAILEQLNFNLLFRV